MDFAFPIGMEPSDPGKRFRRLLLPVGGKVSGEFVLDRADPLLGRPGIEVTVLTVIEVSGPRAGTPEYRADPRHQDRIDRAEAVRRALAARGILANTQVRFGDPAREIVREAEGTDRDLILMGTRGRTDMQRLFLGSVAPAVLQRTRLPVLLFPIRGSATSPPPRFRRIFVPLDGTEGSVLILRPLLTLARDFDSEVCLSMTVYSPVNTRPWRKAARFLEETAARISGTGLKVTTEILPGDPGAQVVSATHRGFDAVAMATNARTPLGAVLWGSETAHVVSKVTVPVLAVARRREHSGRGTAPVVPRVLSSTPP
ncbi:MAG TPA: universal stress protein [Planctomycetota bacterium]|nr:universal stress protein [Planctomycetota bacterium]